MLSARPMWMGFRPDIGCRGLIGRPSGGCQPIGATMCTMQLFFRGSCNKLDSFTIPTNANVRNAHYSANVNGFPMRRRKPLSRFANRGVRLGNVKRAWDDLHLEVLVTMCCELYWKCSIRCNHIEWLLWIIVANADTIINVDLHLSVPIMTGTIDN